MSITQLVSALCAHRYLFAFVLLAAYARRLTAPDSRFPVTVPDAWRPAVTTLLGVAYGVLATLQAGGSWKSAILGGIVSAAAAGFADMLLVAIFVDPARAPGWARALAFLFDDLKGSSPGGGRGPAAPPDAKPGSNGPALRRTTLAAGVMVAATMATACTSAPPPKVPTDLANDYVCVEGDPPRGISSLAQIEADCSPGQIATVVDIVEWILAEPERAQRLAALGPALEVQLRTARSGAAHLSAPADTIRTP
jgi:hypothetical protein